MYTHQKFCWKFSIHCKWYLQFPSETAHISCKLLAHKWNKFQKTSKPFSRESFYACHVPMINPVRSRCCLYKLEKGWVHVFIIKLNVSILPTHKLACLSSEDKQKTSQLHLFLIKCGSKNGWKLLHINIARKNEANLQVLQGEKCKLLFYKTELR